MTETERPGYWIYLYDTWRNVVTAKAVAKNWLEPKIKFSFKTGLSKILIHDGQRQQTRDWTKLERNEKFQHSWWWGMLTRRFLFGCFFFVSIKWSSTFYNSITVKYSVKKNSMGPQKSALSCYFGLKSDLNFVRYNISIVKNVTVKT